MSGIKVFVSVKYNHDQIIERSLARLLSENGYELYKHEGTKDLLRKAVIAPIYDWGGMKIGIPSSMPKETVKANVVSRELIKELTRQVLLHNLIIIVWSGPYVRSFWTNLEFKASLLMKKPIVVIRTDNEPLDANLIPENARCEAVFDIDSGYKTSEVVSKIKSLALEGVELRNIDEIEDELYEYANHNYSHELDFEAAFRAENRDRCEQIIKQLRIREDEGSLHTEIEAFAAKNILDESLRRYIELIIDGQIEPKLEAWYYPYLLGEILDVHFIAPPISPKLRLYYEDKIKTAFNPPQWTKVEALIDEMVSEYLFTREFVEFYGFHLNELRKVHGPLTAGHYWEMCTSRHSEANL
ncbi:MAG: hypothetical protein DKINENOH_03866 [bacterium]|nr:hypothetical protein [bacterium]